MWIVINALWIFNLTEATGHFAVLRRAFASISDDPRVQVVVIAFCFGALLEALAGFGTPAAICGIMLVGLGLPPLQAAAVCLIADTAPVAFGAIAIPITTLGEVSGLPTHNLAQMVGRQTPFLALLVPFVLVFVTDGRRGLRQAWPAALVAGLTFGVVQFAVSNYVNYQLTDIIASIVSAGAVVALTRAWTPAAGIPSEFGRATGPRPAIAGGANTQPSLERRVRADEGQPLRRSEIVEAFVPYIIITIVLGVMSLDSVVAQLTKATSEFGWPGLHILGATGKPPKSELFKLDWFTAAGTGLLISGLLTMIALRIRPALAVRTYLGTLGQIKWALLTVCSVLAIAYVMNFSGQTVTLGTWAAGAGGFFAFLSPLIGWFGTAVTGSDTSTNSLFGALQVTAAKHASLSPTLMAAANSSGGVLAKMVSPQNLAIGAAAVGLAGREGDIFRRVIGWSLLLVLIMAVLVLLQSTSVLSWMVP
jgi:lactate permease